MKLSDFKLKEPQKYFIVCGSFTFDKPFFREIKNAEPFKTKLLINSDLFIAKYDMLWRISDGYSGTGIGSGQTKAQCVLCTCNKLRRNSVKAHSNSLEWAIIDSIEKYGLSPRYEKVKK